MHEVVIALGMEHEEPLLEQHIDGMSPSAFDHELGAGLAEKRRRIVNELTGMRLDTQVDAALRISR